MFLAQAIAAVPQYIIMLPYYIFYPYQVIASCDFDMALSHTVIFIILGLTVHP